MATYRITAPDGNQYDVTAPDDATEDQVLAYAQQNYQGVGSAAASPQEQPDRVADVSMSGLVAGRRGPEKIPSVLSPEFEARAGGDSFTGKLKYSASQILPSLFKGDAGVRDRALSAVPGSRVEQDASGAEIIVTPDGGRFYVNKPGLDMDDVFRFGGQVASFLPAGRLVRGASWGTRALQAGAGAAATDAAGQAASGQGVDPTQVGLSALAGTGGQAASEALIAGGKAAAQRVRELRPLFDDAKKLGINLTPAQLSQSELTRRAATQLGKLPLSGGQAVLDAQQAAGNSALARMLGQKADAVTPDVMASAADDIGKKFDSVFSGGMRYDTQFLRELGALRQEAAALDDPAQNALMKLVERVRTQSKNGAITGRTLQSLDQMARKWGSGGGDRQHVAQAFRESLHEAFGRQAPKAVKEAWDTARRQWSTLKTLEPVVARNPEGGIPLGQIQGAINATKSGRTLRARGKDGELGLLATIGQRIKAPSSSGTSENLMARNWLESLLLTPGGLATRATLNNSTLSPLLMRHGAGQTRQLIAPALPRVAPTLVPRGLSLEVAGGRVATPEEIAADEEIVRRFREGR